MDSNLVAASQKWWAEVKADEAKLTAWLQKQYHGEVKAADRIIDLVDGIAKGTKHEQVLYEIALQEAVHARWVGDLLRARGVQPQLLDKEDRYWKQTLTGQTDLVDLAAVAAHAENMRLARITVIAEDPEAPADIRRVFQAILPQEKFHATAFAQMSTAQALTAASAAHRRGLQALGLIPAD
jgi:rubrerythrin